MVPRQNFVPVRVCIPHIKSILDKRRPVEICTSVIEYSESRPETVDQIPSPLPVRIQANGFFEVCRERTVAAATGKRLRSNSACNAFKCPGYARRIPNVNMAKPVCNAIGPVCDGAQSNLQPASSSERLLLNRR